ncbi:MAG: hypothetical protein ACLR1T_06440 [Evtepia gabavorous]
MIPAQFFTPGKGLACGFLKDGELFPFDKIPNLSLTFQPCEIFSAFCPDFSTLSRRTIAMDNLQNCTGHGAAVVNFKGETFDGLVSKRAFPVPG